VGWGYRDFMGCVGGTIFVSLECCEGSALVERAWLPNLPRGVLQTHGSC